MEDSLKCTKKVDLTGGGKVVEGGEVEERRETRETEVVGSATSLSCKKGGKGRSEDRG